MTTFEESRLRFEFGAEWEVHKYDESEAYKRIRDTVEETKAIDFIGIYQNDLYLIEVKNFRNYRIENQIRITSGELLTEVAQKVRDTIAGVVAFTRQAQGEDREFWERCNKIISARRKVIKVVLWLEYDLPPQLPQRKKAQASVTIDELKRKLRWLTRYVLVTSKAIDGLPDVKVDFLPDP